VVAAALLAAVVIGLVGMRDRAEGSYNAADVTAAFASVGLPLTTTLTRGSEAVLGPSDSRFTVIVVASDAKAREYYKPYVTMKSPDTFQLLAGNVIVESDASNNESPLSKTTRQQIRDAIGQLGPPKRQCGSPGVIPARSRRLRSYARLC